MKKITSILIICLYSLSSLGLGVQNFYCCGKLKSSTLSFQTNAAPVCDMNGAKSGCCKTVFESCEVKTSHVSPQISENKMAKVVSSPLIFTFLNYKIGWVDFTHQFEPYCFNPPPNPVADYISNCSFLI